MIYAKIHIYCTFQFEGFHRWKNAPDAHAYLRQIHRHVFHAKVYCELKKDDREIEFIDFKRLMLIKVKELKLSHQTEEWSCEQWCKRLMGTDSRICQVEVNEDGENGAIVTKEERCTQ